MREYYFSSSSINKRNNEFRFELSCEGSHKSDVIYDD